MMFVIMHLIGPKISNCELMMTIINHTYVVDHVNLVQNDHG